VPFEFPRKSLFRGEGTLWNGDYVWQTCLDRRNAED
jgi:hypothetical protein